MAGFDGHLRRAPRDDSMAVTLSSSVLDRYRRFSRFNSPYPAHDDGCAIDLYPDSEAGISPVAGVVRETRTVGCPDRPYAADEDHLIVVELDEDWCRRAGAAPGTIARILHVVPEVSAGDRVAVGDALGPLTRSGFFGQWVDNHVHLGFRAPGANALRASGSLPVDVDVSVEPIQWDGTGAVVERGPTHVVLDAPTHPAPRQRFAALASDDGIPLDGGLAHYAGGGAFDELVDGRRRCRCGAPASASPPGARRRVGTRSTCSRTASGWWGCRCSRPETTDSGGEDRLSGQTVRPRRDRLARARAERRPDPTRCRVSLGSPAAGETGGGQPARERSAAAVRRAPASAAAGQRVRSRGGWRGIGDKPSDGRRRASLRPYRPPSRCCEFRGTTSGTTPRVGYGPERGRGDGAAVGGGGRTRRAADRGGAATSSWLNTSVDVVERGRVVPLDPVRRQADEQRRRYHSRGRGRDARRHRGRNRPAHRLRGATLGRGRDGEPQRELPPAGDRRPPGGGDDRQVRRLDRRQRHDGHQLDER